MRIGKNSLGVAGLACCQRSCQKCESFLMNNQSNKSLDLSRTTVARVTFGSVSETFLNNFFAAGSFDRLIFATYSRFLIDA